MLFSALGRRGTLPALVCAGLASACGTKASLGSEGPALIHAKPESGGAVVGPPTAAIPVPPEDAPKLAPTAMVVPILAAPARGSQTIGYLRLGAKVSRSKDPVSRDGCPDGWYAVRPAGFVCANDGATVKLDHPLVRAVDVEPNRSRPMPYNYAFVRAIAPNYLRIPSKDEQFKYEARLERHLRSWSKLAKKWDELDVGANDVPLDPKGLAASDIPDHAVPLDVSHRFGGDGEDAVPWWLSGGRQIPNVSSFKAPTYAVMANRIKRHAGVALVGTFVAGAEAQSRRFAVTTDVRLIPADKLKADSGSPFHGADLHGVGLPVAFVYADDAKQWDAASAGLSEGDALPRREMVPLTGRVKMWRNDRFVETRTGHWVKSEDVRTAPKQTDLPWFAKGTTKWIDVSILAQTLVLWEGATPVYATLVSTGKDGLGDPKTTHSTPTGQFRIYQKHVTTTMDSDMADHEFELRDVPWVMYFNSGYALHGAYWHDDFGKARSHGCVNLAPIDARYVFFWADPPVPDHWHAAYTGTALGNGTLVNIHP
ncbi:MAG TPA: L,D-transpeptidase [Polyangiaceae bacterium]|jgi:lipoprotein-anchoring transpeptidase ErfK/SrfK|nr:L,D-transpeptidase [Polyangiaceae bacterium]